MTDWGVHLLDIVQFAFDEAMPVSVAAQGGKFYVNDNTETPDTMMVTYRYPAFVGSYESRTANPFPMYGNTYGTSFHGTKATLMVNRGGYWIFPNEKGKEPVAETSKELSEMNVPPLEQLPRVPALAPEADQRHRDVCPDYYYLHTRQPRPAPRHDPRLGRQGVHRKAARSQTVLESKIPLPLETGGLRRR